MTDHRHLTILSHSKGEAVKTFAESLIPYLEPIQVQRNRTGLVMLPAQDSVRGTVFHLGEVLVSEALLTVVGDCEGYGACLGRDPEWAVALALVDGALRAGIQTEVIEAFVTEQAAVLAAQGEALLRTVEATRVEMETF